MKKTIIFTTALVLILAFTGCSAQTEKSGSESMSASDTSTSASNGTKAVINWTKVNTADEAAEGAKISKFAVPNSTMIADITFKDPEFSYTEHVAEAAYEASAAQLVVRKAEGAHSAPLTMRDKNEFSQSWTSTYEGYDVTCYGDTKGEAAIAVWNDKTLEYGVSIKGTSSQAIAMSSEDVDDIVKAIKVAESGENNTASSASSSTAGNPLTDADIEQIIWKNGYGEIVSKTQTQLNDGKWYWKVTTRGSDGIEHTWVIDPSGNISNVDVDGGDVVVPSVIGMDAADAAEAILEVGLSPDGATTGTVIEQAPDPGTMLDRGDTVSFVTDTTDMGDSSESNSASTAAE